MAFTVIQKPAQTLASWWDEQPYIDLDPIYQRRGHIWAEKDKQNLIDSALNGFDIPKIYLADFTLLDSELNLSGKKYAVIDGKQRLLSLFGFFEGSVLLSREFVFFEDPALDLRGLSYTDIQTKYPKIARRFDNYNLTMMGVVTDDEQKINELFLRLNVSKPLTGAEIRNAMTGEVPALIRELTEHPFWSRVRFSRARGQDRNTAAKLLLIEHTGGFVDTKKKQLDALVKQVSALDAEGSPLEVGGQTSESEEDDTRETTEDLIDAVVDSDSESRDIVRSADRVRRVLGRLQPMFIEHDPVLAQQAQIPVVYWLARETSDDKLRLLRSFLEGFERGRTTNRSFDVGDMRRDMTLIDYELLARTSNDQHSIAGRYRILRKMFEQYLAQLGT